MTNWETVFKKMRSVYVEKGIVAIRSQEFIRILHSAIAIELDSRLTDFARSTGIKVIEEAKLHGSFKDKDVDISVIHPINGPLMTCGVRSQMSSVGKNILTYSQDIMGEAVSLQDRFPMAVFSYCYLLPLRPADSDSDIDIERYSRIFASMAGRSELSYKSEKGRYDHFAFAVVDFNSEQPLLREDLVKNSYPKAELQLTTLVDRMIETFRERNHWLDYFV